MRLRTISEAVQRVRDGVYYAVAIKEFLDAALALTDAPGRARLIENDPGTIPVDEPFMPTNLYNVMIAGLACELANYSGIEEPAWTRDEHRSLDELFFASSNDEIRKIHLTDTPEPYRQRNVICGQILNQSVKVKSDSLRQVFLLTDQACMSRGVDISRALTSKREARKAHINRLQANVAHSVPKIKTEKKSAEELLVLKYKAQDEKIKQLQESDGSGFDLMKKSGHQFYKRFKKSKLNF